jgi:uncharacterized protein YegP (UPF0339 family)
MGKYVIRSSSDGFYFIMLTEKGQVILTSELYQTLLDCKTGIAQVRINCRIDTRYELKKTDENKYYFILKTQGCKVIGISEMYGTVSDIQLAIANVKRNGVNSPEVEE